MATAWVMSWQGYQGPAHRRLVTSRDEARAVLAEVDAGHHGPVLVDIHREGHEVPVLTVGVGGERSVATWQEALDPPYFGSTGAGAPAPETFSYGGHESEFAPGALVPKADALLAAEQFIVEGGRPTAVGWAEV